MLNSVLTVLTIGYITLGVIVASVQLLVLRSNKLVRSAAGGQLNAVAARLEADRRGTRFGLIRDVSSQLLETVSVVIAWPVVVANVVVYQRLQRTSSRTATARLALGWSDTVQASGCALLTALLAALCVAATGRRWYLVAFCWALIVANLARQLSVAQRASSIAEDLRPRLRSPFLQLGCMATADFGALTLAAVILLRWSRGSSFQLTWLPAQARQILAFEHVSALWHARTLGATEVLVAMASVAVYTLVLSQLKTPQRLMRTNSDKLAIAHGLIFAGRLDAGERWLRSAIEGARKDSDTVTAEGLLAMLKGDLRTAFGHARIRAGMRRLVLDDDDARDDALVMMLVWAKPFVEDVGGAAWSRVNPALAEETDHFERVVAFVIAAGISDAALAGALARPRAMRRVDWDRCRRVGMTDPPFTLVTASLEISSGLPETLDSALGRLQSAQRAGFKETLVASTLRGYALLMLGRRVSRQATIAQYEVLSRELTNDASDWSIETFPTWLRQWASDYAAELQELAEDLGDRETVRAINELRATLVGKASARGDLAYLAVGA